MAYYGGYQQNQFCGPNYQPGYSTPAPPPGLAGYGGPYRVNQPAYYAGPSYSTTSDNDFQCNPGAYQAPSYGYQSAGGFAGGYGGQGYAADPYNYFNYQQPQQPSYSQQPQQVQQQPQIQQQQPQLSTSASQIQQPTQVDDIAQLAPQIEAAYEAATGQRRQPVIKRQVITVPGQPGKVQQVVRRLPTPTPDVIERVFIVKPHRDVVNLVIERPATPPAQYKDKTVIGKPKRPVINPRIIRVAPRSNYYQQIQYQPGGFVQALPPPSLSIPPTASSYQFQPQQPTTSQHYQPQMSQAQLSQASQTQIPQQSSYPNLAQPQPPKPSGFLIAPIQYDASQQNYVQMPVAQVAPVGYGGYGYGAAPPAPYGCGINYPNYFAHTAGYPTPYGARIC